MHQEAPRSPTRAAYLFFQARSHRCAIPLADAVETLRPLPVERLPGMPRALLGLAIVRGATVPVVDVAALFDEPKSPPARWVLTRAGERRIALAVTAVSGVGTLDDAALAPGLDLAAEVAAPFIAAIATREGGSLAVLDVARLLPEAALEDRLPAALGDHG